MFRVDALDRHRRQSWEPVAEPWRSSATLALLWAVVAALLVALGVWAAMTPVSPFERPS